MNQTAQTIINQMGGAGKLQAMVGACSFSSDETSVSFRFSGSRKFKAIKIELTPEDLYKVTFFNLHGSKITKVEFENISCDMLINLFETETGLALLL